MKPEIDVRMGKYILPTNFEILRRDIQERIISKFINFEKLALTYIFEEGQMPH